MNRIKGPIKGWHVFGGFALGFGVIISVNLVLAISAVRTFPGLEVKNSYVASQKFEDARTAQKALNWQVEAWLKGDHLYLSVKEDGAAIAPMLQTATFGRATHVGQDQTPEFIFDGAVFKAPVVAGKGNWNLRMVAHAADGTVFQQRIVVGVEP